MTISSVTKLAQVGDYRSSHHTIKLMLRIEHIGRDRCVCLNRVRGTASSTGLCLERMKFAPTL
ncbi:hypothetical protein F383_11582 [Gossypium arboreum]|uniref:Uncharacterized protein n=1 Tax=Gossypium arboreum TaxID=29729 RepID=A0A0B0PUZ5_GOSAR|nr:hypothetical protein F383_11582 [Gossypium arboreum]